MPKKKCRPPRIEGSRRRVSWRSFKKLEELAEEVGGYDELKKLVDFLEK